MKKEKQQPPLTRRRWQFLTLGKRSIVPTIFHSFSLLAICSYLVISFARNKNTRSEHLPLPLPPSPNLPTIPFIYIKNPKKPCHHHPHHHHRSHEHHHITVQFAGVMSMFYTGMRLVQQVRGTLSYIYHILMHVQRAVSRALATRSHGKDPNQIT